VTTTRQVHTRYNGGSWQPATGVALQRKGRVGVCVDEQPWRADGDGLTDPTFSFLWDRPSQRSGWQSRRRLPSDLGCRDARRNRRPFFFFARSVPLPPQPSAPSGRCSPDATPVAVAVGALRCRGRFQFYWLASGQTRASSRPLLLLLPVPLPIRPIPPCMWTCGGRAGTAVRSSHRDGELLDCILYSYTTMAEQSRQKPRGQIQKWGYIKSFMHHA
jgi:hypothetical protein